MVGLLTSCASPPACHIKHRLAKRHGASAFDAALKKGRESEDPACASPRRAVMFTIAGAGPTSQLPP